MNADYSVIGYYYLPLPYYKNRVLKHYWIACKANLWMKDKYPEIVIMDRYLGDRIDSETHELFTSI